MPNWQTTDSDTFAVLLERHRRELQAHCYRMMGSVQDAEDLVQETFLHAWRGRGSFEGRASVRVWLYAIATNVCLDALRKRPRQLTRRLVPQTRSGAASVDEPIPPEVRDPIWLEPYPDEWLVNTDDDPDLNDPERAFSTREAITLAFIAALHLLPPRQRAVLLMRDVLEWSASDVAAMLDTTVSAVKSALHRARATLAEQNVTTDAPSNSAPAFAAVQQLDEYIRAWQTADVDGLVALLKDDATFSMPPIPAWYRGRETIRRLTSKTIFAGNANGRWRLLPTHANRQIAFGLYRQSDDPLVYNAYGIQVLTFNGEQIADIITFRKPVLLAAFNLPPMIAFDQHRSPITES